MLKPSALTLKVPLDLLNCRKLQQTRPSRELKNFHLRWSSIKMKWPRKLASVEPRLRLSRGTKKLPKNESPNLSPRWSNLNLKLQSSAPSPGHHNEVLMAQVSQPQCEPVLLLVSLHLLLPVDRRETFLLRNCTRRT